MLKNMSANKSLILGGQVKNVTKITFLARTHVKGTLEDLFGQRWTGGRFLLVESMLQGKDYLINFTCLIAEQNLRPGKQRSGLRKGSLPRHLHKGGCSILLWFPSQSPWFWSWSWNPFLFRSHHSNPQNQVKSHLPWIYAHTRTHVKYKVVPKGTLHSAVKVEEAAGKHARNTFWVERFISGGNSALASCGP